MRCYLYPNRLHQRPRAKCGNAALMAEIHRIVSYAAILALICSPTEIHKVSIEIYKKVRKFQQPIKKIEKVEAFLASQLKS